MRTIRILPERTLGLAAPALALLVLLAYGLAHAHVAIIPLGGKKLSIKADGSPDKRKFVFKSDKGLAFAPADPVAFGASLLVYGTGADAGHTGSIELDPTKWKALGNPPGAKGYTYKDKAGTAGGVTKVGLKPGVISIVAKGSAWPWSPAGAQNTVSVRFTVGDDDQEEFEAYCAVFGGDVTKSEAGRFSAKRAPALSTCPDEICGDGQLALGEECDDGNLDDTDGCNADCTIGECTGQGFESTFEGIQAQIFDDPAYGCTNPLCHSAQVPAGQLDLTAGNSYANLVDVPSVFSGAFLDRVEPGNREQSFLFEKLEAGVNGTLPNGGSAMPVGSVLTADHLEAIRLWIQGGAPETGVVAGTQALLEGCLPEPTPLKIPIPDPPGAGVGVQVWSNPWDLPSQFENEVCFATYYDFTGTGLIPESAKVPCPTVCSNDLLKPCSTDGDCGTGNECVPTSPNNVSGECFRYHVQSLFQDPQSHHAFVRAYMGQFDTTHGGWGEWTYKFQDKSNALQGQPCDPTQVDPSLGYNPGCSSDTQEAVACLGSGPPDLSNGASVVGATGSGTTPTFTGSGVPVFIQEYADGVYGTMPMQGILVWNSHAFNLTNFDSTMSIYLNIDLAAPADQLYAAEGIFDPQAIFVQDVAPYETAEYCRSWTAPQGAHVFMLSSHTHQWGVRWRTWGPPNAPCGTSCAPRGDAPLYLSTEYTDPLNLYFDPPLVYDSPNAEDRTFLYCSLYDNGSTTTSPGVKRRSTSSDPPLVFGLPLGPGGPCGDATVACLGGPNRGQPCGGDDSACDTTPGAGDGICDACPVKGGVTTTDEMFILIGGMYVVPPGP